MILYSIVKALVSNKNVYDKVLLNFKQITIKKTTKYLSLNHLQKLNHK